MLKIHNFISFFIVLASLIISQAVYGQVENITTLTNESVSLFFLNIQYIFIGSCIIPSLICFVWARALRSTSMAFLALYFSIQSLLILADGGISLAAVFTNNLQYLTIERTLYAILSAIILIHFTATFFSLKKHLPMYFLLLRRLTILLLLMIPISYPLSYINMCFIIQIVITPSLFVLLYVVLKLPEKYNHLTTIYFVMILVQLSINLIGQALNFSDISAQVINFLDMLAFWLMVIIVTYLIGRRYYGYLQNEKQVQKKIIANAKSQKIAQQELLTLQQQGHELLECKVQERTLELNIALQELESVNKELQEKNTLDELSGLYNRRFYDQKILAEFRRSRRNLTPLSIVLVDIDHFKKVNDSYGHLLGDKCIVEISNTIKVLLNRSSDVGCRYGGEEFCLILPETNNEGAITIAQELCKRVSQQPIVNTEFTIKLTISCGVSTYQQEESVTPEILFDNADKALYKAKQSGRNQVQAYTLNKNAQSS